MKAAAASGPQADAGQYQVLTYSSGSHFRVCKANTSTSEILCVDGPRAGGDVKGVAAPDFKAYEKEKRTYFRYAPAFPDSGRGMYAFFDYYRDGKFRVCVGQTTTGAVYCRDGADESATLDVAADPKAALKPFTGGITWWRYFGWGEAPHAAGTYTFDTYTTDGKTRVCRQNSATGVVVCAIQPTMGATVAADTPPKWEDYGEKTTYYRY